MSSAVNVGTSTLMTDTTYVANEPGVEEDNLTCRPSMLPTTSQHLVHVGPWGRHVRLAGGSPLDPMSTFKRWIDPGNVRFTEGGVGAVSVHDQTIVSTISANYSRIPVPIFTVNLNVGLRKHVWFVNLVTLLPGPDQDTMIDL